MSFYKTENFLKEKPFGIKFFHFCDVSREGGMIDDKVNYISKFEM